MKKQIAQTLKATTLCALMVQPVVHAKSAPVDRFFVDYLTYEEYVYSQSKKTEIGDQVELDISLQYRFSPNTWMSLGFETYPEENRFDNKTSKFELEMAHKYNKFELALDAELQTDESSSGGTSIGLDIDSEDTYLSYAITPKVKFSFYPFNFDGEVGEEFNTWDVTRIYYIEGSPSAVLGTAGDNDSIAQKTIPGFVLSYEGSALSAYAGLGAATYLYPTDEDFDITDNSTSDQWERREDIGYKAGFKYKLENRLKAKLEYVGHTKSEQTGSLLESAASAHALIKAGKFLMELEGTYTVAGKAPWRVSRSSGWFSETTPFQPIYSDNAAGNKQDWIGEKDFALAAKVGFEVSDDNTPFAFVRYQGEHFVFRERESAHILRTGDETKSHGGLTRAGIGSYIYEGNFTIKPELEYMQAKNPVFGSSADVRKDRKLSTFKKKNYQISLEISYSFDNFKEFSL